MIPGDTSQIQEAIYSELHGSTLGGHLGGGNMDVLVKKWFYWPLINKDIRQFFTECDLY